MADEPKTQLDKFKEAARDLETDDDPERFKGRVGKLVSTSRWKRPMLSSIVSLAVPGIVVVCVWVFHPDWIGATALILSASGIGMTIGYFSRRQKPKEGKPDV